MYEEETTNTPLGYGLREKKKTSRLKHTLQPRSRLNYCWGGEGRGGKGPPPQSYQRRSSSLGLLQNCNKVKLSLYQAVEAHRVVRR
jgi:hypothetical protein